MVDEAEARRAADYKAREDRINKIMEEGKKAKVIIVDEREKRQWEKVERYESKKEKKKLNDLDAKKAEEMK